MRYLQRLALIVCALICPALAWAQGGVPASPIYFSGPTGRPLAGATVTVCTSAGTGFPCSPLASIFTNAGLTLASPNPVTTDGNGNLPVIFAAPGVYILSVAGSGITPTLVTATVAGTGGGNVVANANTTFTGIDTFKNSNAVVYVDAANVSGWAGTSVDGWIASASAALAGSVGTVHINAGAYTINSTIQGVTNVTIECDPSQQAVLTASASINSQLVHFNGVNHAGITGCKIEGNRTNNANSNDFIRLTNASHINIDHNWLRNGIGIVIDLFSGNSWIDITRNEIERWGPVLPGINAAINGNTGASPSVHIKITENKVHDGNTGIFVQPALSGTTYDWEVAHNRVWANANDGIAIFSPSSAGFGQATGLRFIDNDSECNGWPANGTGFDPFCTAGFLQAGAVSSSSGSGLDLNSANMEEIIAVGNTTSHNFYEGIDSTPQRITVVNTSGTTVTYVSGDPFQCTVLKTNQGIQIVGSNFLLSTCNGATTTLTLTTSAGVQTGVQLFAPGYSRNVISSNVANDNGHGNGSTSGAGIATISIGDKLSNNVAVRNNAAGFNDNKSANVTHSGDIAFGNNLSGAFNGNFLCSTCLRPNYFGINTDGNSYGIVWDSQTTNAYASSSSLSGSTASVNDLGANDVYEVGQQRFGLLTMGGIVFASLGAPGNGTIVYCSDCTIANPCAGGGTGALAKRLNGVWVCN